MAIDPMAQAWTNFLKTAVLLLIRVSGLMVFAPPFSSKAIPVRIKIALTVALTWVIVPLAAASAHTIDLGLESILGELSIGLLMGICISFVQEALTFAGYLLNLEFSFSLVNVLDPGTSISTPLMGQFADLIFLLVLFTGGLYRVVVEAMFRTIAAVPPGHARFDAMISPAVVTMFGGILLAGLQLASPIMAATFLVQITVALVGKISPTVPVMILGIPLKTLSGYAVLIACLGLWPSFIDQRFSALLDTAMRLMQQHARA